MSLGLYCFSCLFLLIILGVEFAQTTRHHHFHHNHHNHHKGFNKKIQSTTLTVTVDPSGHGDFSTIQSAINSVPSNNNQWVLISVKAGIYREKLKIPSDKQFIVLKGEGKTNTIVKWDDHNGIADSPTFISMADNLIATAISFLNSYNNPKNSNSMQPAVAATISGDKSYFYEVGFYGLQDTLWDNQGRHYYKSCTIEGAMDFIFGTAQSLYEECSISVIDGTVGDGIRGFITAQGRTSTNDPNGFVFKNCDISGNGTVYLGRAWRDYARVFFYKTQMSNVVEPLGWDAWKSIGHEGSITFGEYGSYGAGSDMSNRVSWAKKFDEATANELASIQFIDTEGWVDKAKAVIGQFQRPSAPTTKYTY